MTTAKALKILNANSAGRIYTVDEAEAWIAFYTKLARIRLKEKPKALMRVNS